MKTRTTLLTASLLGGLAVALTTPLLAKQQATPDDDNTPAASLPALGAANDDTSVIGVSSGGYMASQLAVAWPERFVGLGVISAGPWGCAQGSLSLALTQCMLTTKGPINLDAINDRYQSYLKRELVGPTQQLSSLRVYTWHGSADSVVALSVGQSLTQQLEAWLTHPKQQLRSIVDEGAAHGWPVGSASSDDIQRADCATGGGSHLLNCDRQVAEEALDWLHGPAPLSNDESTETDSQQQRQQGKLVRFDQSDFEARGLADEGYLFIPASCEAGGCPVSIALHGCNMSANDGDERFVRHSGLNERAAREKRVILYPQAKPSMANPQGCWDWWGFTESSWQIDPLHDSRQGRQANALMQMLDTLQSAPES
ncbi:PHB depolymerase family esterase [Halomonas halocynthiae]|uniref:PHB depolymerase family esterase n=1 Tax=Halomonas halocynthiae TaxID=176290 RepID=UPI000418A3BE|nr:PHB depolymerase family esterase [Halomonas halocynthiae]